MVAVVLILNGLLVLLCLYATWQVCRWRSILANVADALTAAERSTHRVLHSAPQAIATGQLATTQLQQQYRLLTLQLQQVQQILALLGLGQLAWRQYSRQHTLSRSRRSPSSHALIEDTVEDGFDLEKNLSRHAAQQPNRPGCLNVEENSDAIVNSNFRLQD